MGRGGDYSTGRTRAKKFSVGTGSYPVSEGSTRFGDTLDDIHIFTGSLFITGSLYLLGNSYGISASAGPSSSVTGPSLPTIDHAIARWNGTLGNELDNSTVILQDNGDITSSGGLKIGTNNLTLNQIVGTSIFTNNTYFSGNLDVTNSTKLGYSNSSFHQLTGNVFLPTSFLGNTTVTGSQLLVNNKFIASGSVYLPTTYLGTTYLTGTQTIASGTVYLPTTLLGDTTITGSQLTVSNKFVASGSVYLPTTFLGNSVFTGSQTIMSGTTYLSTTYLGTSIFTGSQTIVSGTAYLPTSYLGQTTITGSYLSSNILTASNVALGNTIITGSITYISGALETTTSTHFGYLAANLHQFTGSVSISGSFTHNGPETPFVTNTAATYTIVDTSVNILLDATSNNIVATLPSAVGRTNVIFTIKRIDNAGFSVTINSGGGTIDGQTSIGMSGYNSYKFLSNGTNWFIL